MNQSLLAEVLTLTINKEEKDDFIMRAIFLGKDKPSVISALKFMVKKKIEVVMVVGPIGNDVVLGQEKLVDVAEQMGIPTATDDQLYEILDSKKSPDFEQLQNIDLVISFLFWKKIKKPLISLPKIGCINFHAAPLPDFRGVNGYSFAIYENFPYWGVSAHLVDESIDSGDIIKVSKFDIDPKLETAFSLEQKSQVTLLELFEEVIEMVMRDETFKTYPQGKGHYFSKEDFEKLRKIQPDDSLEKIERKIRAFWYPPYGGACLELQGKEFTLINEKLLEEINEKYWKTKYLK